MKEKKEKDSFETYRVALDKINQEVDQDQGSLEAKYWAIYCLNCDDREDMLSHLRDLTKIQKLIKKDLKNWEEHLVRVGALKNKI